MNYMFQTVVHCFFSEEEGGGGQGSSKIKVVQNIEYSEMYFGFRFFGNLSNTSDQSTGQVPLQMLH